MIEKTLVVLKPDCVLRGLVGEVIHRFERVGLKMVAIDMRRPDKDFFFKHYEEIGTLITRAGQNVFDVTVKMVTSGPVIAMVFEGSDSVEVVRKLSGVTESKSAAPGTIRGDFSHMSIARSNEKQFGVPNILHASGDSEEAKKEIELWFPEGKFMDYKRLDEDWMM